MYILILMMMKEVNSTFTMKNYHLRYRNWLLIRLVGMDGLELVTTLQISI